MNSKLRLEPVDLNNNSRRLPILPARSECAEGFHPLLDEFYVASTAGGQQDGPRPPEQREQAKELKVDEQGGCVQGHQGVAMTRCSTPPAVIGSTAGTWVLDVRCCGGKMNQREAKLGVGTHCSGGGDLEPWCCGRGVRS